MAKDRVVDAVKHYESRLSKIWTASPEQRHAWVPASCFIAVLVGVIFLPPGWVETLASLPSLVVVIGWTLCAVGVALIVDDCIRRLTRADALRARRLMDRYSRWWISRNLNRFSGYLLSHANKSNSDAAIDMADLQLWIEQTNTKSPFLILAAIKAADEGRLRIT